MCGIFGYAGFDEPKLLERMGTVLQHRGPDDVGYYRHDRVHLGIRRLSIIDLAGGKQPVTNEDGALVVVYNGELYNYLELTKVLQARGHTFTTRSDTEVIVHAYEEYGIDFLHKLHGMFAFALYDVHKRALLLARDRIGIKPLYYYCRHGKLIFASEIKAILGSDAVERACNLGAIEPYLELRYAPNPTTLFQDIYTLPAAHYMYWQANQLTLRQYWQLPPYEGSYRRPGYYKEQFEAAFVDAVRTHMRSDVPVGAYLSGGVDSSLVVAAMRGFTTSLKTFSIGFDSPIDETRQARELATALGCEHHEVICLPEHFALLPKVLWHLERPIGDALILAYYMLAQETSKQVKVVLSGEGADELFAGYLFHKVLKWTHVYKRLVPETLTQYLTVPCLKHLPVTFLNHFFSYPAFLGETGKERVVRYLQDYPHRSLHQNYIYLRSLFDPQERQVIYTKGFRQFLADHDSQEEEGPTPYHTLDQFVDQLLKLQFHDWLQDNLLLRQDKSTMAHSLEMRVPFLDHRLVEFAFHVPNSLKIRWLTDKYIERDYARKLLPKVNARRSKNPFYIPLEYIYQHTEIQQLIHLTLRREQVEKRGYFAYEAVKSMVERMQRGEFMLVRQVMSLVILELWHLIFLDKQQLW